MNELGSYPGCKNSLRGCYDITPEIENDWLMYFEYECKNCGTFGKEG